MTGALAEKTVIITGASSGIGKAAALVLAREGANIVLAARSADKLAEVGTLIGHQGLIFPMDVTDHAAHQRLVEAALQRFGQVDALLANAGIYVPGDFISTEQTDWSRLLEVNINGVLSGIQAVLPHMLKQEQGDIIVTSSISGHQAIYWEPVYSASKHAIQAFVHGLRRQVSAAGVRVGAIAPGIVLNELWGQSSPGEIEKKLAERGGMLSEDIAEALLFMLTRPRHVTIRDLVMLPQNQDI